MADGPVKLAFAPARPVLTPAEGFGEVRIVIRRT